MMSYAFKKKKLCCQSDDKPEKSGSSPQVALNSPASLQRSGAFVDGGRPHC